MSFRDGPQDRHDALGKPLAAHLRDFVNREDELFCSWKHEVAGSGGFVVEADRATGTPSAKHSSLWDARYGGATTADTAPTVSDA